MVRINIDLILLWVSGGALVTAVSNRVEVNIVTWDAGCNVQLGADVRPDLL
jgi:hypothetical protein